MQRREMPGNKADGAEMAVQPRRTRTRWQSRDCGAVRGLNGCAASSAAKRRPAFSADSQALHTIHLQAIFQLSQNENQHFTLYLRGCGDFHARKNGEPPKRRT